MNFFSEWLLFAFLTLIAMGLWLYVQIKNFRLQHPILFLNPRHLKEEEIEPWIMSRLSLGLLNEIVFFVRNSDGSWRVASQEEAQEEAEIQQILQENRIQDVGPQGNKPRRPN